jgi:hypothetical protein
MTFRNPVKLSHLRDIGWKEWDPIGLLHEGQAWDHKPFADEYDGYLLHVVGLLRDGKPKDEAVAYLNRVGSEHMGLGPLTEAKNHASAKTVELIADYLRLLQRDLFRIDDSD